MRRRLGARLRRIDRVLLAVNHVFMERVFHVGRRIGLTPKTAGVRFVFGEQQFGRAFALQGVVAEIGMRSVDAVRGRSGRRLGLCSSSPQDQVLRNHNVGSR